VDQQIEVDCRIWGKERGLTRAYPLVWHAVDTAAVALAVWDDYLAANVRRTIAAGLGVDGPQARVLVAFWAGLHDLGKITPGFQGQVSAGAGVLADPRFPPLRRAARPLAHQAASQAALDLLLREEGYRPGPDKARDTWCRVAQIAGGHHGRFAMSDRADVMKLGSEGWAEQRSAVFGVLHAALGRPEPPVEVRGQVAMVITGVVILSDWLASQDSHLEAQLPELPADASDESVAARLRSLAPVARRLLSEAGLGRPRMRAAEFTSTFGFAANPLQASIIEELLPAVTSSGLLVLTAATGDGKTEAALAAAVALADVAGAAGFYFALPTMATSDEMYRRVRRFAGATTSEATATTLLHSMSWLTAEYETRARRGIAGSVAVVTDEEDDRLDPPRWLRGRKRGLLAPLSVGTVDQALIAALTTKHNALRMLGLVGKVFIVDEAHAYDDYMRSLLERLLAWLGYFGCPVVLLSATLPSSHADGFVRAYAAGAGRDAGGTGTVPYPGWSFLPADPQRSPVTVSDRVRAEIVRGRRIDLTVDVRRVDHSAAEGRMAVLAETLESVRTHGGHVAVVCNTVDDAQRTYTELTRVAGGITVDLLHSRFPASQREEITHRIVERLRNGGHRAGSSVTVATQVIEQSLDLDFDLVLSDLAPLAQLLQRAGRCQRHPSLERPRWAGRTRLVVLLPTDDDGYRRPQRWGEVYDWYLLAATDRVLAGLDGGLTVPDDVQLLMESVYATDASAVPDDLRRLFEAYRSVGDSQRMVAGYVQIRSAAEEIGMLARLSEKDVQDADATTRLGADSARVLCCYRDADGRRWFDPAQAQLLPLRGGGPKGRMTTEEVRAILGRTFPVRTQLVSAAPAGDLPKAWRDNAWLSELTLLEFPLGPDGPEPLDLRGRTTYLDPDLGLVSRHADSQGHR
jgi:CRISPR-associated endonuclease/helicase Cas3